MDEPSSGNLRLSTGEILTHLSLLMPAFSLVCSPALLTVWLQPAYNAPLPLQLNVATHSFGDRFEPRTFSAQDHSTSELLRTL